MTQRDIEKAYVALLRLGELKLPIKKAYEIYGLLKKFGEQFQFGAHQEKKIVERYNGVLNPNGSITFCSSDVLSQFNADINELQDMEVEIEFDTITLSASELGNQTISPLDIKNLEGVIIFEF